MAQSPASIDAQSGLPIEPGLLATLQGEHLGTDDESAKYLKNAFEVFNQLSLQLTDSYHHLEKRVADLTSELDYVSEQRYRELQQKEQLADRLETLIQSLPGGVVLIDKQGVVVEANPAAEGLLEWSLVGKTWRDVIQHCFAPRDDDGHEVSSRNGKRISIITRSLSEEGQIILLTDQTETRRLQDDVSRNERLSALGKMVSTLAHQVRTPLSSAMLYANHLCSDELKADQRQSFTQKLLNRLHFMERQVRDMLLFVRGEVPLTDTVSLAELQQALAEAVEMPIKSYAAKLQWQNHAGDCRLRCNLDAVVGALLNLVNNSLQATPDAAITIRFEKRQQQLHISILDNGKGLNDQAVDQAQEMFFTTKQQGTGIGLSVVNVVAQSHGGHFSLRNREQGGVCACMSLPFLSSNKRN